MAQAYLRVVVVTPARHATPVQQRDSKPTPQVLGVDFDTKSLRSPHSALQGISRDRALLAAYQREVRQWGKRGAYRRTAHQFNLSDEWTRQIIQAWGTLALLYYVKLRCQAWAASPTASCQLERETPRWLGALDNPLPIILAHNAIALRATRWIPIIALAYLVPVGVLLPAPWQLVLLVPIAGAAWVAGP